MTSLKTFSIISLSLFFGSGCDIREVETLPDTESNPILSSSESHSLKAKIESLKSPARYQVELRWQESEPGLQLHRRRGLEPYEPLNAKAPVFLDEEVISGESYRYALFRKEEANQAPAVEEVEVRIPQDWIIDSVVTAEEVLHYHRLYFTSQGILRGKGSLRIQAKEIHSDGGKIENIASEKGLLSIEADKASGKLTVVTQGEPGKAGRAGQNGVPGKNGATGKDGKLKPKNLPPQLANQFQTILEGQNISPSDWSEEKLKQIFVCESPPTNGEPGGNGGAGSDGEPGGKGGDSGKLAVKVRYADQLKLTTAIEGGIAEMGGTQAKGGREEKEEKRVETSLFAKKERMGNRVKRGSQEKEEKKGETAPSKRLACF